MSEEKNKPAKKLVVLIKVPNELIRFASYHADLNKEYSKMREKYTGGSK